MKDAGAMLLEGNEFFLNDHHFILQQGILMNMQIGLSPGVSIGIILAFISVMLSGFAGATFSVEPGHSIQSAINIADPGQIIEVQNGTFNETVNVTKPLTL
jgi:hypothetical protein